MKLGGIEYDVILTYECQNCGRVEHINAEEISCIRIDPAFLDFALGRGGPVALHLYPISHLCNSDETGGASVIGMANFEYATIVEKK